MLNFPVLTDFCMKGDDRKKSADRENKGMAKETYIGRISEAIDVNAAYDENVKQLLADRQILSRILKDTVEPFGEMDYGVISTCIEGTPALGVPVMPGLKRNDPESIELEGTNPERRERIPGHRSRIRGDATESVIVAEGRIIYDVRFSVHTSGAGKELILVDVEAQNNFYPGYKIPSRAVFYCARMISEQMDTEFDDGHYDDMKKVYSIWICVNVPQYLANTIVRYEIEPGCIFGQPVRIPDGYDHMSIVMLNLGEKEECSAEARSLGLLYILLKSDLPYSEKRKRLETVYGIQMTYEFDEGVKDMCNLSAYVEERGAAKERINTERERARADAEKIRADAEKKYKVIAIARAEKAEDRVRELEKKLAEAGISF